jgi:hypothetical protein
MGGVSERLAMLELQRTDPKEGLAEIDRKLDKVLSAGTPRDAVAGVRADTAALHTDIEGVRGELRHLAVRMQRLTDALFGGASS